jgi:arylsulfatase A-like enzyme
MISHLDDAFGRLLAALQAKGCLDDTIVIMAGDNGLAVGQHGLMGKQNLYDHSVRVPLVFAGPGIPAGQRRDALVYLLDIFPTLCELAGMEAPGSVEGMSLGPCLDDPAVRLRDSLYLAYEKSIRGITDARHKLIEYACGRTQLFDLSGDPAEMVNLADHPSSQATLVNMRTRLVRLAEEWSDENHPAGEAFWDDRAELKS